MSLILDKNLNDTVVDTLTNSNGYKKVTKKKASTEHHPQVSTVKHAADQTIKSSTDPLHIVLVTETWYPDVNGVAMSLGKLMGELVQLGHKVSLVRPEAKQVQADKTCCMTNPDNLADKANEQSTEYEINQIISKEICVQGVPIPRYPDMQFGMPQYRFIKRELKKMDVDIVHIATEGPLGLATLTAAKRLKLPVTTGYHTQFHDFSKHFGMGLIARPMMAYFKWFHNWSDATCVPSAKTQNDLSKLGFERIYQVGRGVDTAHFNPSRRSDKLRETWGTGPQDTVLVMVSRLSPEKGVDVVIEAFSALQTTQMHRAVKLVIVGDGPDRTRLETLAASYDDDIIFTGAKLGLELAEHYASGDAFVFASQVETFGNVVTEAMASGLPVFAFDDAAAGMLVTEETGALVPLGEKDAFIDMVAQLPKTQRLYQQGQQAREAVLQFSWIRPARQMLQMFKQAIAKADSRRQPAGDGVGSSLNQSEL